MGQDSTGISIMTNGLYIGPDSGVSSDIQVEIGVIHTQ